MPRIKLTFQYDGSPFHGFQRVNEAPSVQECIEKALQKITGEQIELKAAGRTDKGVHALGQVAHFDTIRDLPLIKYLDGVNHFCHPHVVVTQAEQVENDFHARHTAIARTYEYHLAHNQRWLTPTLHKRAGHVRDALDIPAMQKALAMFPRGEMDFSSFRSSACQCSTPMVYFEDAILNETTPNLCTVTVTANHFLHNMIRIFMGTLLEIGTGRQPVPYLKEVLEAKNRQIAGITFSPNGLYLSKIIYPPHKVLESCIKKPIL